MDISENNLPLMEKIQEYLDGTLSASDHTEFEKVINKYPDLAEMVLFFGAIDPGSSSIPNYDLSVPKEGQRQLKGQHPDPFSLDASIAFLLANPNTPAMLGDLEKVKQHIEAYGTKAEAKARLEKLLKEKSKASTPEPEPEPALWRKMTHFGARHQLAIAACLLLVLTIVAFLYFDSGLGTMEPVLENQDQYVDGFQDAELPLDIGDNKEAVQQARNLYNTDQYLEAYLVFEEIVAGEMIFGELEADWPYINALKVYQGICQLRMGDVDLATALFTEVLSREELFMNRAIPEFYLGIAYLKADRTDLAAAQFEKVQTSTVKLEEGALIGELATRYLKQINGSLN